MAFTLSPGAEWFYGVAGGAPPPTNLRLRVGRDGLVQLQCWAPWPLQPPFDEVGTYERRIEPSEAATLRALAPLLAAGQSSGGADAGSELLAARSAGGVVSWRGAPTRLPEPWRLLRARLRTLAADLRARPVAVVHAQLMASDGAGAVRLHNRGVRACPLAVPGGARPELYLGVPDDVADTASAPEWLVGSPPARPSTSEDVAPLEPGETRVVEFAVPDDHRRPAEDLQGLLRLELLGTDEAGRPCPDEAWLWLRWT